jgi:hypothetical protein
MVYVHLNIFKRDFILFLFFVTGRAVAVQMLEMEDDKQHEKDFTFQSVT